MLNSFPNIYYNSIPTSVAVDMATKRFTAEACDLNASLQKALSAPGAEDMVFDLMKALQNIPMTVEILKISKVGITVNKAKKMLKEDSRISDLAKGIVESWKEIAKSSPVDKTSKAVVENKAKKSATAGVASITSISKIKISADIKPVPKRSTTGEFIFPDFPEFRPNLSPKEVLNLGSFGGTYFRPISSSVTKQTYSGLWKELPIDWLEGLDIKTQIASPTYRNAINKYKIDCGGDLAMWESSGWIMDVDPYGWFQWYCRFFQGRRTSDDARQISRGLGVMGAKGRWRRNLVNKCLASISSTRSIEHVVNDTKISPKVRQLLQHWGYALTAKDLQAAAKKAAK